MRFVVTGAARSGTGYLAQLLQALGINAGHERVYTPEGRVSSESYEGDVSWLAVPHLTRGSDIRVAHLLRDPRRVIGSLVGIGLFDEAPSARRRRYLRVIANTAPEVFAGKTPLERACRYWRAWTALARDCAAHEQRVEDLDAGELLEFLGYRSEPEQIQDAVGRVPRSVNHRRTIGPIPWDQLPEWVRIRARRFGYSAEEA